MRSITFILLFALCTVHAKAQLITFGPKVGINYSRLLVDETFTSNGVDYTYATSEAMVGLAYGVFGRLKLGPVFFQPEILFTQDNTEIKVSSINFEELQTLSVSKLDIPLLFGLKLGNTFKIMGGPVKTYILDAQVRSPAELWDSYRANKDQATWGYQVGIGLDVGRFMFGAVYEGGLGEIASKARIGDNTYHFDHRQELFRFSVAYQLIK